LLHVILRCPPQAGPRRMRRVVLSAVMPGLDPGNLEPSKRSVLDRIWRRGSQFANEHAWN
jgi:hypothetical protein